MTAEHPDRTVAVQRIVRWTLYGVLLIISILGWQVIGQYMERQNRLISDQNKLLLMAQPVQVIDDSHLVRDSIPQGGVLEVTFVTTRTEACRVLVDSFIVDAITMAVLRSTQNPAAIQGVGEHMKATVDIQLPDYIGPGSYLFRAIIYNNECTPTGRSFTVTVPSRMFEVVAR